MIKSFRPGRARSVAVGLSLLGFLAGSIVLPGCSDPSTTVIKDESGVKNKRTDRIDKAKSGTLVPPKKAGP